MKKTHNKPLFSTFTHSVGAHDAGHGLPSKLHAIARAGYDAVEIFQDDLDAFTLSSEFQAIYEASTPPESPSHHQKSICKEATVAADPKSSTPCPLPSSPVQVEAKSAWNAYGPCTPSDVAREIAAASHIAGLCNVLGLEILTLQPLRDYEGWVDPQDREAAMMRAKSRFQVMRALGTDLIIVCSNNTPSPKTTSDIDTIAQDLSKLADSAKDFDQQLSTSSIPAARPIRIAFEALSWGAHIDDWSRAWEVVKKANRSNLGICFDSFNVLGKEFADPCSPSGIQQPESKTRERIEIAMRRIEDVVPGDKVFFLQVGDARKLVAPLIPSPNESEPRPSRMIWSRGNRLFPGEMDRGGFMPVTEFVKAVIKTGYQGPWSVEVFNSSLSDEHCSVPDEHAQRGFNGLSWLFDQVFA